MTVPSDFSASLRDLRVLSLFAAPLPRLSPKFEPQVHGEADIEGDKVEKYEVVISGVCT